MNGNTVKKHKHTLIYCAFFVIVSFLILKYALFLFLPFIISFAIAFITRPIIKKIHSKTNVSNKFLGIFFVLLIIIISGLIIILFFERVISELKGLIEYFNESGDVLLSSFSAIIEKISEKFPFLNRFFEKDELFSVLTDYLTGIIKNLSARIPELLAKTVALIPETLFFTLVMITSSYYFISDYDNIMSILCSVFPEELTSFFSKIKTKLISGLGGIFKGYLTTIIITFSQLFVGFLMIRLDYAFILALITALIDILPVLGVGTVLLPLAVWKFIIGSYYQGFGLVIIFAVVTVIREILEPKIMSNSIGLHPLFTLFSMYMGYKICGVTGLLFSPFIYMTSKIIFDSLKEERQNN